MTLLTLVVLMFKTFCNNYKTGHVETAYPFILSKLKLSLYQLKMPFIGPILLITLENNLINCVSHSWSLGVTLDNKLCRSPHIKSITANFNAKLNKLKQMKTFDHTTLETIYFKGILPSVTYCISLWAWSNSFQDLEDSHIRAVLLIHNISPSIPKHEVLSKAKWYSL